MGRPRSEPDRARTMPMAPRDRETRPGPAQPKAEPKPEPKPKTQPRLPSADYLAAVTGPQDRSAPWFMNCLTETLEGPLPGFAPLTEKDAACRLAGVSPNDFGLVGALNLWAGNTDRANWLDVRSVLNQKLQGKTLAEFRANPGGVLSEREALYHLCLNLQVVPGSRRGR
jgi:hypothetical protein